MICNIGYTYVEYLQKIINKDKSDNKILFAPSWVNQKNDLIEKYGKKIISELLKINDVILRPHPQSLFKSKKEINSILEEFKLNPKLIFNNKIDKIEALDMSSILVTDNGGMAMEYYILYKRPIICINYIDKIHNKDFKILGLETLEDKFKKEFTKIINIENIELIKEISEQYVQKFKFDQKKLDTFLKTNGVIFNKASDNASKKISEILVG